MQDPVCSSPGELECVNKVNAETSSCLKPCSGLLVNSFSKVDWGLTKGMKKLKPILENYNNYKKITGHPSGENGKQFVYPKHLPFSKTLNIFFRL